MSLFPSSGGGECGGWGGCRVGWGSISASGRVPGSTLPSPGSLCPPCPGSGPHPGLWPAERRPGEPAGGMVRNQSDPGPGAADTHVTASICFYCVLLSCVQGGAAADVQDDLRDVPPPSFWPRPQHFHWPITLWGAERHLRHWWVDWLRNQSEHSS